MREVLAKREFAKRGAKSLRTCVSCGRKAGRDDLLRVVNVPDGFLTLDWSRKLPGRGVHVCPIRRCIENAVKGRRFDKALRSKVQCSDAGELLSNARIGLGRQVETLMRSGIGARSILVGVDSATTAIGEGKAHCVIVAADCTSRELLMSAANGAGIPVRLLDTKENLGGFLGRSSTGAISVLNRGLASALLSVFDRIEGLA